MHLDVNPSRQKPQLFSSPNPTREHSNKLNLLNIAPLMLTTAFLDAFPVCAVDFIASTLAYQRTSHSCRRTRGLFTHASRNGARLSFTWPRTNNGFLVESLAHFINSRMSMSAFGSLMDLSSSCPCTTACTSFPKSKQATACVTWTPVYSNETIRRPSFFFFFFFFSFFFLFFFFFFFFLGRCPNRGAFVGDAVGHVYLLMLNGCDSGQVSRDGWSGGMTLRDGPDDNSYAATLRPFVFLRRSHASPRSKR